MLTMSEKYKKMKKYLSMSKAQHFSQSKPAYLIKNLLNSMAKMSFAFFGKS
jgi:hypothetical protein